MDEIVAKCREFRMSVKAVKIIEKVLPHISFSKRLAHGDPIGLTKTELQVYNIVSDADMLEAMGVVGVIRTFMFQAVMNNRSQSALTHIKETLQVQRFSDASLVESRRKYPTETHETGRRGL